MASYSEFIIDLFDDLTKFDVDYLVLRNYEKLPDDAGNDVDLLVDSAENALIVLDNLLSNSDWRVTKKIYGYSFFGIIIERDATESLQIDFFEQLNKKWVPYLNAKEVLSNKKQYNNINVISNSHYVYSVVAKELLTYGSVREKYYPLIDNIVESDQALSNTILEQTNYFSIEQLTNLLRFINEDKCRGKFYLSRKLSSFINFKSFTIWLLKRIHFQLTK